MTLRGRILLLSFFAACALAAYGVYWWHETVLDDLVLEESPYSGDLLDEVVAYLKPDAPDRAGAEKRLLEMPEWDRDRIIAALAAYPDKERHMVAIGVARKVRDRPIPRAVLARLAVEDPDPKIKEAAKKALNGDPP